MIFDKILELDVLVEQPKMLTLFRYPLSFSYSPLIHKTFGEQIAIQVEYTQTEVQPGTLKDAIDRFRQQGGIGANVTMPLKEEAFRVCTHLTERARIAQSVNTLYWRDNQLWGDNTDGIGFYRDVVDNLKHSFTNKVVCILGAGGAARGIIADIANARPKKLFICNRTFERAAQLTQHFQKYQIELDAVTIEDLNAFAEKDQINWIIQARPSTIEEELPFSKQLFKGTSIYELSYSKQSGPLPFSAWALTQGAVSVHDGLGMLVEQAAEAFQAWFLCKPLQTQSLIETLKKEPHSIVNTHS